MIKLLGNRVLVRRIPKAEETGFAEVKAVDDFVGEGEIVMVGDAVEFGSSFAKELVPGARIVFAKFSPDTRTVDHDGEEMKAVLVPDIIGTI